MVDEGVERLNDQRDVPVLKYRNAGAEPVDDAVVLPAARDAGKALADLRDDDRASQTPARADGFRKPLKIPLPAFGVGQGEK